MLVVLLSEGGIGECVMEGATDEVFTLSEVSFGSCYPL